MSAGAAADAGVARPIRVLHVLASFRAGGTEQGVVNLVNHCDPGLVRMGLCVLDAAGAEENLTRIADRELFFRAVPKRFANDPSVGWRLARVVDEGAFDVIHSHGWPTYLETWLALKLRPRLLAVHGEHGTSFLERRRRRIAFGALSARFGRFLFVSRRLMAEFVARTRIPAESMQVIPNGVDFARFRADGAKPAGSGEAFAADWLHIGTAGRLHEVKNHAMLLRAAARARDLGHRWRFHIAGEGPLRERLESFVRAEGLEDRVRLHGHVEAMNAYYRSLDVFVLTSRSEGHPNALLEAMASERAVITTPTGDVAEFIRDGENGWLVAQDDSEALLARLLDCARDEARRAAVARQGFRDAERRYGMRAMTDAYGEVYQSLLATPGTAAAGQMRRAR